MCSFVNTLGIGGMAVYYRVALFLFIVSYIVGLIASQLKFFSFRRTDGWMDGMGKEREEGLLIANINLLPWLGLPSLIIFSTYRHDAAFCFLDIGEIDVDGRASLGYLYYTSRTVTRFT